MSDTKPKRTEEEEDGPPKKRSDLVLDPRRRERGVEPDKKGVARPDVQL